MIFPTIQAENLEGRVLTLPITIAHTLASVAVVVSAATAADVC
jgi:hypothetical protein